jgi:hypothetical protein
MVNAPLNFAFSTVQHGIMVGAALQHRLRRTESHRCNEVPARLFGNMPCGAATIAPSAQFGGAGRRTLHRSMNEMSVIAATKRFVP